MSIIFILVGLPFIGIGCALLWGRTENERVTGEVYGYTLLNKENGTLYPVVRFRYRGSPFFIRGSVGSPSVLHPIGRQVKVKIFCGQPLRAQVADQWLLLFSLLFIGMGALSTGVGLCTFSFDWFSVIPAAFILGQLALLIYRFRAKRHQEGGNLRQLVAKARGVSRKLGWKPCKILARSTLSR